MIVGQALELLECMKEKKFTQMQVCVVVVTFQIKVHEACLQHAPNPHATEYLPGFYV